MCLYNDYIILKLISIFFYYLYKILNKDFISILNMTELLLEEDNKHFITFDNIKTQLNQIILFDRPNLNYYELILSIILMFEYGIITKYKINFNEYTQIFKIVKTIKIPTNELDNLKKIIIYE